MNAWALEFTKYRRELYKKPIEQALRTNQARLAALRARGQTGTPAYQALLQQRANLQTYGQQLGNNAVVWTRAVDASSFRPHVLRNALLAGALGALLGIGLTFAVVRLRKRA